MVFAQQGFSGTTVEVIADAAGYSRGAFYAHFSSKEDILFELAKTRASEIAPLFVERIEAASDADEAIDIVADLMSQRTGASALALALINAMTEKSRSEQDSEFVQLLTGNWRRIGEALRRFCPNGQMPCEPDETIAILVALTYSPVVRVATRYDTKRLVEITLRALMNGQNP